jgi:cell division transport system permease protein
MPYVLREALAAFRRTPFLTTMSAAMIGLSLLTVGLFGITAHNIRLVLNEVEERVEIVAYLRDDAIPEAVAAARREIAAFPEVLEVQYISREQALEIAQAELPEFRALFGDLDTNPLPASLEIRLLPGQRTPEVVERVAQRVAAFSFVEEIRYGEDWLEKVYLLRRIAATATVVLGGAFGVAAVLIIGAAVRMAVFARRSEIAIMRLVGATDAFIRGPFLLEGLFTGLLGALLALGSTYGIYRLLSGADFRLEWIPPSWVVGGVAAGGILGVLASAGALRRHLRDV